MVKERIALKVQKLTPKQQAYANYRIMGSSVRQSYINAGYSKTNIYVEANKLEENPAIQEAMGTTLQSLGVSIKDIVLAMKSCLDATKVNSKNGIYKKTDIPDAQSRIKAAEVLFKIYSHDRILRERYRKQLEDKAKKEQRRRDLAAAKRKKVTDDQVSDENPFNSSDLEELAGNEAL